MQRSELTTINDKGFEQREWDQAGLAWRSTYLVECAMSATALKEAIRSHIEGLMEIEPASRDDLADWHDRTKTVSSLMELDTGDLRVPHVLWHYLADADIRLKDQRYAEAQLAEVKEQLRAWMV